MINPAEHYWTLATVVIGWGYLLIVFILSMFLPTIEGRLYTQNTKNFIDLLKEREKKFEERNVPHLPQNGSTRGLTPLDRQKSQRSRFSPPSLPPVSPRLKSLTNALPENQNDRDDDEIILDINPNEQQKNNNNSEISEGEQDEQRPAVIHHSSNSNLLHQQQQQQQLQRQYDDGDIEENYQNNSSRQDEYDEKQQTRQNSTRFPQMNGTNHVRNLETDLTRMDPKPTPSDGSRSPRSNLKADGRKGPLKRVNFQEDA